VPANGNTESPGCELRDALARAEKAEARAEDGERALGLLLNHVPGMVYRRRGTPPYSLEYASAGAQTLSGYSPQELVGGSVPRPAMIAPEDLERIYGQIGTALQTRTPFSITYPFRHRSGEMLWVQDRGVGIYAADGRVQLIEGFVVDVTVQKTAEEALWAGEQRLQVALEAARVGTWRLDLRSGREWRDANLNRIFGLQPAPTDGPGDELLNHVHPDDRPVIAGHVEATRRAGGGSVENLYRVLLPDGTVRWVRDRGRVIHAPDGTPQYLTGAAVDVTERVQAERALSFMAEAGAALAASWDFDQTLNEVARLAVGSVADGCLVHLLEANGRIRSVGSAPTADLSVEPFAPRHVAALEGSSLFIERWRPERVEEVAFRAEEARSLLDAQPLSVLIVPMRIRERVLGTVTLWTTVRSGRIYTAPDLAAAEDLGRRVALYLENARLYQQAQRAVSIRDEFLSVASHELKTPLTPLSLKLQTLAKEAEAHADRSFGRRVLERMGTARRQVTKLAELIDDLLDVSRISAGKLTISEGETLDFMELVSEIAARFQPEADKAGSPLAVEGRPGVVGRWDRNRLEQVVTNLLSNAIKYGSGKPIFARVESAPGRAVLTVCDQGIGMDPEALPRVFKKFERAVSERNYGGLGLGLYVTKQIVEAMGGSVKAESALARGSAFTVELPLHVSAT